MEPAGLPARRHRRLGGVAPPGYRATIEALSQEQRDTVREQVIRELDSAAVTAVRTDVVFATAERPC